MLLREKTGKCLAVDTAVQGSAAVKAESDLPAALDPRALPLTLPFWGPDDPGHRSVLGLFGGALGEGCNLNLTLASICCGSFLFLACQAFCQSTKLPSNFLELFPHRRESFIARRKWFSPILFPRLWPSSCRGCTSDMYRSCFYTLWEIYFFLSSVFPPQLIFL